MKALVFHAFGGPEVLALEDIADPALAPGTVKVRTKAIGLNYADVYRRRGHYHLAGEPPYILGYEGAGVIEEAAPDVNGVQVGDRVGFADAPHANAELVVVPADKVIPLPDEISFETAAAVLLQGLTAHYLANDSFAVGPQDRVLVHAAAGGVGQLLVQLCKAKGARVLGLTSSEEKREAALRAGADEVLLYGEDWADGCLRWSAAHGRGEPGMDEPGMDVAYDSVGATLMDSFRAVRTRGTVVFFGMAGGDPPLVDPRMLMDASKTLTGGDLWNHVATAEARISRSASLFEDVLAGRLRLEAPRIFSLADGADAHRLIESRTSTGKILLIP
ncbi:quinone oxidoreductase family protein [Paenibacillus sacheonensis]|uniref:Zinc-binding dehydrogenase n=1 Tax=Paenibacillus sacheonensis TaxID=742054 RepID=A0A7X4YQJ1_9BACL|nr:quinone oxidoreductase [Paenibacillus sacheonensis]MBM7566677.1 NADPH2:quinone reductase [Paenibacillus sacheonensis]NBC70658.1 zinc-binding dehydrogenase [Paenibacillus sacheonensis]